MNDSKEHFEALKKLHSPTISENLEKVKQQNGLIVEALREAETCIHHMNLEKAVEYIKTAAHFTINVDIAATQIQELNNAD